MIIYKATNIITGECYIGQTTNSLHNRKVDHIYEAFKRNLNDKFHTALREFGCKNFIWESIAESNNLKNLAKKERELIIKHQSIEYGYNTSIRNDKTRRKVKK